MGCSGLRCTNRDSIAIFPQVSWEFGCVSPPTEFTEFTEVLLRWFSHGIHGIHRSLVASVLPQNSRNSQKFCCVAFFYKLRECSVEGASLPEGSVCSVRSVGDIPACFVGAVLALAVGNVELRLLDSEGSVGTAGCHTLLICAHPCQSVGGASQPEGSVLSVRICGRLFSARRFRVFRAFCGRYFSTRRVRSVGDYSFSMRKRLTMPKTRA